MVQHCAWFVWIRVLNLLIFYTVAVWTQKKIFQLLTRPQGAQGSQGSQGGQKITFFSYKWNCFPFALTLPPKDTNFKNHQSWRNNVKKPCFLTLFRIFFILRAILAHQTSTGMFSGSWCIFWHPWDPWGRVNSGVNGFWLHTVTV